jgi:hypothetical protein
MEGEPARAPGSVASGCAGDTVPFESVAFCLMEDEPAGRLAPVENRVGAQRRCGSGPSSSAIGRERADMESEPAGGWRRFEIGWARNRWRS